MAGGLGLGLGLNKRQQQAFQTAAQSGTGADWLGTHKKVANRVQNRIQAGSPAETRLQQFIATGQTPWKGGAAAGGAQPPAAAPTATAPPVTPGQPPPNASTSIKDMAEKYAIKTPEEISAAGQFAMGNLPKIGQWDDSRYEEQFNRLMQQSAEKTERGAAELAETYGSRGARYGSDIQTAQSDLRRKSALDLQTAGFDVRQGLNQQRLAELAGTMGALQNVGASKANISTAGMERAWQEYAMKMAPPAMWDEMMGYATSFSPPGTVVY